MWDFLTHTWTIPNKTCGSNQNIGTPFKSAKQEQDRLHNTSSWWLKFDIPLFARDDAFGWTNLLERYFRLQEVSKMERIQVVMIALEGKALNWFQWWESCNSNPNRESFKLSEVHCFQPNMLKNPCEVFIAWTKTGSIEESFSNFIFNSHP